MEYFKLCRLPFLSALIVTIVWHFFNRHICVSKNDAGFIETWAIYLHGKETSVLTGWVKEDGSIEAARINLKTKEIQKQILFNQLEKDDHDNPAFLELADNGYIAFYAKSNFTSLSLKLI